MTSRVYLGLGVSVLVHFLALSIPLSKDESEGRAGTPLAVRKAIEVTLASTINLAMPPPTIQRDEEASPEKARGAGSGPDAPKPIGDSSPKVISDVPVSIDFATTPGFMIISLVIDERGEVEGTEVVYTELPAFVAQLIEKRFASARFSPATKQQQAVRDTVLMKVSVE